MLFYIVLDIFSFLANVNFIRMRIQSPTVICSISNSAAIVL